MILPKTLFMPTVRVEYPLVFLVLCFAAGVTPLYAQNLTLIAVDPANGIPGSAAGVMATGFTDSAVAPPVNISLAAQVGGTVLTVPATVQGTGVGRNITFIVPPGPSGLYSVTVSGAGLTSNNSVIFSLTAVSPLTLIAMNPASGGPNLAVTLTAAGFQAGIPVSAMAVVFTPASGPGIIIPATVQGAGTARTLNFIIPGGFAAGVYAVGASGAGFASTNTLPFTVTGPASFTLNPVTGIQGTTVMVTIIPTNTSFPIGTTARFGPGISVGGAPEGQFGAVMVQPNGTAIATLVISADASIGARTVDVNGQDAISQPGAFSVTSSVKSLTLISINPNSGVANTLVSVTATGFDAGVGAPPFTIDLTPQGGGVPVNVPATVQGTGVQRILSFVVPAIAAGPYTVSAFGTGYISANSLPFTVTAPTPQITSVSPNAAQQGQSLSVTITGTDTNFSAQSVVSFGAGISVNSVVFSSPTSLTASLAVASNAPVGLHDVTVTTGATSVTGAGLFNITDAPPQQLISATPSSGQVGQTLSVTILGSNTSFTSASTVSFGPGVTVNSVAFNGPTSLTVNVSIASNAAAGPRDLTVTTGGVPLTGSGLFTVVALPAQITQIQPNSGEQGQSLLVTITGSNTNFSAQSTVSFGPGITVTSISATSATRLTANINIAAGATPGLRDVTVTTNGTPVPGANLFTVIARAPALTSISPSTATQGQTLNVTLIGANTSFAQGSSQVSLGAGITINSVTVTSPTSIVANITIAPQAALGERTVSAITGVEAVSLAPGFSILQIGTGPAGPLTCTANAGVPPLLRAEGFTELTGDIVIVCTGGTAGQTSSVNLQLFLNTPITSRIIEGQSEALLIVDEVATAAYRALPAQGDNSIVWPNVQVTAPGADGQRVFRITNVRSNAVSVGIPTTLVPGQVIAFLSASPGNSLPIGRPQLVVGYVQPGLKFDVTNCNATSGVTAQFVQCSGENSMGIRDLINGTNGNMQFAVRFTEGFHTAFKPQLSPGQVPSTPGAVYNSESGFLRTPDLPYSVGGADSGTRLVARFTNLPSGARLFVTTGPSFGSTQGLNAVFVRVGPNGEGTSQPAPNVTTASATLFCAAAGTEGISASEILVTKGSATAVWEIAAANPAVLESAVFGVGVAYAPDTPNHLPGVGQSFVSGNFAPFYTSNPAAGQMSASLPIPRFVDAPQTANAFRVDACVTNLLFPYVTNQADFDTGIAISNTSRDSFGNVGRLQSGLCTITYFGSSPSGPAPPAQTTNAAIDAGSTMSFVLSSGGSHGIVATPGFQGYLIVRCDFRYGHGFAFITDGRIGAARVAEGYLALGMDAGTPSRGSSSEVLQH